MAPKLVITDSETGDSFQVDLTGEAVRIGRADNRNDIVLDYGQVSREHAVLQRVGGGYLLTDKSANGTFINGERVNDYLLKSGDSFVISKFVLVYKDETTRLSVKYEEPKATGTVVMRAVGNVFSELPQKIDRTSLTVIDPTSKNLLDDIELLRKKAETLSRLYELNQMLGSVFSLEDIFKKVSEMLFRLTPADRFLVLLKDTESDQLSPIAAEFRDGGDPHQDEEISISKTVLDQVVSERISMLSLDAQSDERLAQAKSIILQNIRSVICAPLLGKQGVLGVIYVDCQHRKKTFSTDDLELLNALASETAIAVDNAITHEQLLREALARAAFGRFMPEHVVSEILANPDSVSLGGSNLVVTALFSDIRGFTSMSETLPPDTVVKILNEYFVDMTPIVFEHRGLLDKYMGDGLMALFGVPYPSDDAAADAVSAAIAMQRRMVVLNQDLKEIGLPEIAIGIGINTGMATVGYIGSEQRTDYTAIGDAVNLAARLEKQAEPWQIIVSHATLIALGDRFVTRPCAHGEIKIKGKKEPVQPYEIVWQDDVPVIP